MQVYWLQAHTGGLQVIRQGMGPDFVTGNGIESVTQEGFGTGWM